ncbi:hypothetical protein KFE25_010808 [Diacronema lutheri]|uniref:Uncharacterized protein n=1 Tax=Diacronema lutheri TaxID=2081491 RepID=A0A8J5XBW3_DIALT|nr:hypothetical protein KFE25_010808 [Diacronema lutheri]
MQLQIETPGAPDERAQTGNSGTVRRAAVATLALLGVLAVAGAAAASSSGASGSAAMPRARADDLPGRRMEDVGINKAPGGVKPEFPFKNDHCVGKMEGNVTDPDEDGAGYICSKAIGEPNCTTPEELSSLYCACCFCYRQCRMQKTPDALCIYQEGFCPDD